MCLASQLDCTLHSRIPPSDPLAPRDPTHLGYSLARHRRYLVDDVLCQEQLQHLGPGLEV